MSRTSGPLRTPSLSGTTIHSLPRLCVTEMIFKLKMRTPRKPLRDHCVGADADVADAPENLIQHSRVRGIPSQGPLSTSKEIASPGALVAKMKKLRVLVNSVACLSAKSACTGVNSGDAGEHSVSIAISRDNTLVSRGHEK